MNTEAKRVSELRALNQEAQMSLPDFYPRATGEYLTQMFTQQQFDKMSEEQVEDMVWEGVQDWTGKELCSAIRNSVDNLERAFVHGFLMARGEL